MTRQLDGVLSGMLTTPTVFVVDDDPSLRTAVRRLLASVGLRSQTFATAEDFRREIDPSKARVPDSRRPHAGCEWTGPAAAADQRPGMNFPSFLSLPTRTWPWLSAR